MKNLFFAGRLLCIALLLASLIAWVASGAWWWFFIILAVHIAEALFAGIRVGSQHGKSIVFSFISTMLFGLCWWLALKLGYLE